MQAFTNTHPSVADLRSFLDDSLQRELVEQIGVHIETCTGCQQQLEDICNGTIDIAAKLRPLDDTPSQTTKMSLSSGSEFQTPTNSSSSSERASIENIAFQHTDRYILTGVLGRGGMGTVFSGFDTELQREIAIKVLQTCHHSRETAIKGESASALAVRFYREAQISGQLQHPGIIPIHELGRLKDGRLFIAMKLIAGKTLDQLILEERETPEQVSRLLEVFSQVCRTMAYAHSKGIIHRDLKPMNIMVGKFGEVQVVDWGIAKKMSSLDFESNFSNSEQTVSTSASEITQLPGVTVAGAVMGTPAYMPPEQALGKATDRCSDVFSLGGILCAILTGKPPFNDSSNTGALAKAADNDLASAFRKLDSCEAAPALFELAKDCLARNPLDRPKDAEEVYQRLCKFFDQRDERLRNAELRRVRSDERLEAERRRYKQRFVFGLAIAAVLLLTGIATTLYVHERIARRADQENIEEKKFQLRYEQEARIRTIIDEATEFEARATTGSEENQVEFWNDALNEIHRGENLATENISLELLERFNTVKGRIANSLKLAANEKQLLEAAEQLEQAIKITSHGYILPKDGVLTPGNHQETMRNAFAAYDVQIGVDPAKTAEALAPHTNRDNLLAGLRLWRNLNLEKYGSSESKATNAWFAEVLDKLDPVLHRQQLRTLIDNPDPEALFELLNRDAALDSKLSVYWALDCLKPLLTSHSQLAIHFLKRAHLKYPDDFAINWTLSNAYTELNRTKEDVKNRKDIELSLRHMLVCMAIRPDNKDVLVRISNTFLKIGELDLAIKYGNKLATRAPFLADGFECLAKTYLRADDTSKALENCERALKVNPKSESAFLTRTLAFKSLGRLEDALESVDGLLVLNPENNEGKLQKLEILKSLAVNSKDAQAASKDEGRQE